MAVANGWFGKAARAAYSGEGSRGRLASTLPARSRIVSASALACDGGGGGQISLVWRAYVNNVMSTGKKFLAINTPCKRRSLGPSTSPSEHFGVGHRKCGVARKTHGRSLVYKNIRVSSWCGSSVLTFPLRGARSMRTTWCMRVPDPGCSRAPWSLLISETPKVTGLHPDLAERVWDTPRNTRGISPFHEPLSGAICILNSKHGHRQRP